jgi:outer membrane protein assembly factor BamB
MYALNVTNGKSVWTNSLLSQSGNMQPTWTALYVNASLGPVFFYNDFYDMDCVNATNGKLIWQSYLTREDFALPVYSNGCVYAGRMSNALYVNNATDGRKIYAFNAGAEIASSVAIYNNSLFFGTYGWNFFCVGQPASGTTYIGNPVPSATPMPAPTSTPTPTPTVSPTSVPLMQTMYNSLNTVFGAAVLIIIVVIIAILVVSAVILRRFSSMEKKLKQQQT